VRFKSLCYVERSVISNIILLVRVKLQRRGDNFFAVGSGAAAAAAADDDDDDDNDEDDIS
jgi:hypothetical protein